MSFIITPIIAIDETHKIITKFANNGSINIFIQENGKRSWTTKSDKHSTSFPFRVKENVFGKYTISYPMFET